MLSTGGTMAKHVLIIDESTLFKDFIKEKLEAAGLMVSASAGGVDALAKMRGVIPDLVILDNGLSRGTAKAILEEKRKDANAAGIPVVLTATEIDKSTLLDLAPLGVKRILTKPLKMDAFYAVIEELLAVHVEMDATPCIVEAHVNDRIIFVEIAKGLNREKIDLLRFKLHELIELYDISSPKVLLLLSDITLDFADGPNIEYLLKSVMEHSGVRMKAIKMLTRDSFLRQFIEGHKAYSSISVVDNLQAALDDLLGLDAASLQAEDAGNLVSERILSASEGPRAETVHFRFDADRVKGEVKQIATAESPLQIAVVDDDVIIQELIRTAFAADYVTVTAYPDGSDFLAAVESGAGPFALVFLDILMPKVSGFDVLERLKTSDRHLPIIILSSVTQRESVVKSIQLGVKSYLVKPLKPDALFRKALEILKPQL
jgi:DNA-binding response OmpR family regulator